MRAGIILHAQRVPSGIRRPLSFTVRCHVNSRARLLLKIFDQGFRTPDHRHTVPPPVVSLEDFFDGNTRPQSIATNLPDHPGLGFFRDYLMRLRSREDVQDVLINVYDLSDIAFFPESGWPHAENVHILTSAPETLVQSWAEHLRSDGAGEGWPYGKSPSAPEPKAGFIWWWLSWD